MMRDALWEVIFQGIFDADPFVSIDQQGGAISQKSSCIRAQDQVEY